MKALGDGFVKLIKMAIAPIIFCTVTSCNRPYRRRRRSGGSASRRSFIFEIVSTFALMLGLLVGNVVAPGAGFPGKGDAAAVAKYLAAPKKTAVEFLLDIIPDSVVGAFAKGDILEVLFFSVLFGFALLSMGERARALRSFVDDMGAAMFGVISLIMKAAPIGAFGAMAYTVGKYGSGSLLALLWLIGSFYAASALFVFLVLGAIAHVTGFSILRFLAFIKDELLIVLAHRPRRALCPR